MAGRRLARLDLDGWELESALARHARWPDTFHIPSEEERATVRPGQAVKLLFRIAEEGGPGTDRMWVYVTDREEGWYRGRLQNDPGSDVTPAPGMVVWFRPEHIIEIDTPPPDYEPY